MGKRQPRKAELERVIEAAGSLTAIADALGITPQTVSGWRQVPPEHCKEIERLFSIPAEEQRPDIFGSARRTRGNGRHAVAA